MIAESRALALLSFYPSELWIGLVKHLKKPGETMEPRLLCLANSVPKPSLTNALKYPEITATHCLVSVRSTKGVDVAGRGMAFLQVLQKRDCWGQKNEPLVDPKHF